MQALNFELEQIDHVHIYVSDRQKAEAWYRTVLGLVRVPALAFWAEDGGPLVLENKTGTIHLALFESLKSHRTTVAFRVNATVFGQFIRHLKTHSIEVEPVDHSLCWSIYFEDPYNNPFEITTYDYALFKPYK